MDLYEYQARDLFEKHGVPVLPGIVATTPEEAEQAAIDLGGRLVVVGQSPGNFLILRIANEFAFVGFRRCEGPGENRRSRQGGWREAGPQPAGSP